MIVNVNFDTTTKALEVSVDGSKMENVSEVEFYGFEEDKGSVSIRQFEEMKDDMAFKMTKIIAVETSNNSDKYEMITEDEQLFDIPVKDITQRLFPNRRI